ncbi:hypothetical protein LguiB_005988 [Lonicera macranthoides]
MKNHTRPLKHLGQVVLEITRLWNKPTLVERDSFEARHKKIRILLGILRFHRTFHHAPIPGEVDPSSALSARAARYPLRTEYLSELSKCHTNTSSRARDPTGMPRISSTSASRKYSLTFASSQTPEGRMSWFAKESILGPGGDHGLKDHGLGIHLSRKTLTQSPFSSLHLTPWSRSSLPHIIPCQTTDPFLLIPASIKSHLGKYLLFKTREIRELGSFIRRQPTLASIAWLNSTSFLKPNPPDALGTLIEDF